jgi:AraC-like DNA-binding protein
MSDMTALTYALDTTWRALLHDLGVAPSDVLRRAGLPDDLLAQPSVRLQPAAFYRFWDALEAAVGDPCFSIRVCRALRAESFSPPLFAALCSPDFETAVRRIARYKALVAPMRLEVDRAPGAVSLGLVWLDAPLVPPPSLVLAELLFFVSLARTGTRSHVRPLEVETTVLPSPVAPFEDFLGARLARGTRHRLRFTEADATRPFLTSNAPLWATFEPALRARLADLDAAVTTAQRVRAVLLEGLPAGLADLDGVARRLATTPRTLQRRLAADGTTWQGVLRETREALAWHYLGKTALPVAEVAFLLGYDEPNSFWRAFRAWTGTTPEAAREAKRGDR